MSQEALKAVPLELLSPHPDNPRLALRADVVERIGAEIGASGFADRHAITVRVLDDAYQIIAGHHRVEAAKQAGLSEVPAWVADMSDDEAFMQLVLDNNQGELTPLEIGGHALRAVPAGRRGRGNFGGIAEYARRVGWSDDSVRQWRSAAEVTQENPDTCRDFSDRHRHLYEVSKAPRECWTALADALGNREWTVADTSRHVTTVNQLADTIPAQHAEWLPLPTVVQRYIAAPERVTPRGVKKLIDTADEVLDLIGKRGCDDDRRNFLAFLAGGVFDGRRILDHRATLIQEIARREAEAEQQQATEAYTVPDWHHGRWQDHVADLDDDSVALVLTDPPYGVGYQSDYRVDRTVDHRHDVLHGDSGTAVEETRKALESLHPKLADDAHVLVFCTWRTEPETRETVERAGYTVRGSLIWTKNQTGMGDPSTTFAPKHERIIHAVKGSPKLLHRAPDVLEAARVASDRHPTEKPIELLTQLIEATTSKGQTVADPFAGVGSTCVAAKDTDRAWWGCEVDETYWAIGEERLS